MKHHKWQKHELKSRTIKCVYGLFDITLGVCLVRSCSLTSDTHTLAFVSISYDQAPMDKSNHTHTRVRECKEYVCVCVNLHENHVI